MYAFHDDEDPSSLSSECKWFENAPVTRSLGVMHQEESQQFNSLDEPLNRGGHNGGFGGFGDEGGVGTLSQFPPSTMGGGGRGSFWDDVPSEDLSVPAWPSLKPTSKASTSDLSMPSFPSSDKKLRQELPPALFSVLDTPTSTSTTEPLPELEPVPFFVEKYTTYRSTSTPSKIADAFANLFDFAADVDYELKLHRHQIKAVLTNSHAAQCHFRVQLYKDTHDMVVEFQRRSGCALTFSQFVKKTVADLPEGIISGSFVTKTGLDLALKSLDISASPAIPPPPMQKPEDIVLDADTTNNLLSMAGSSNADVQREALQMLAFTSKDDANQKTILSCTQFKTEQVLDTLNHTLTSPDTQVRLASSHLLRNLCQQEDVRSSMATTLGSTLAKAANIGSAHALDSRDTQRQLAVINTLVMPQA